MSSGQVAFQFCNGACISLIKAPRHTTLYYLNLSWLCCITGKDEGALNERCLSNKWPQSEISRCWATVEFENII
jgi:hypothetical protein